MYFEPRGREAELEGIRRENQAYVVELRRAIERQSGSHPPTGRAPTA